MENKTNNRVKILNAAWKLFEEKGYDNTTVDEIIEATDTSKGTFYNYYKSKRKKREYEHIYTARN